jgi:hypothetical protein
MIDREFDEAGLPAPTWKQNEEGASISLVWPSPLPWDGAAEERQLKELSAAANQMVNSLRPRLLVEGGGS